MKATIRICDLCMQKSFVRAVGYYFPDIDKNAKIDVCQHHKERQENKGLIVWLYDE